jgi:hypothetical protein
VWLTPHENRHWRTRFERRFELAGGSLDPDLHATAAPMHAKRQASPRERKIRIDGQSVVAQGQAGEAEYRRHPEASLGRNMDTSGAENNPYVESPPNAVPDISATSEINLINAWNGTGPYGKDNKKRRNYRLVAACNSRTS